MVHSHLCLRGGGRLGLPLTACFTAVRLSLITLTTLLALLVLKDLALAAVSLGMFLRAAVPAHNALALSLDDERGMTLDAGDSGGRRLSRGLSH